MTPLRRAIAAWAAQPAWVRMSVLDMLRQRRDMHTSREDRACWRAAIALLRAAHKPARKARRRS